MKYLIAGLGNIGADYELTRHNIGFLVLDKMADEFSSSFEQNRHVFKAEVKTKGRTFHLIKPTTYMNLSGKAVAYWLRELKVPMENLLVISDDIALPFGKLRMRAKGSSAGHNGLGNIETFLGSSKYPRLKFGIGDDFPRGGQVNYVLSRFSKQEFEELPGRMDKAIEMITSFGTIGISKTMSQYND